MARFAEYLSVPEDLVETMPANLSFEQAAAVPLAGNTALTGLHEVARLQAGQHILINGASDGVGTFAVQIARAVGAEVSGVCSARNIDLVRSVGAHHVIDYSREDFARRAARYDVVFDLVGNRSLADCSRWRTTSAAIGSEHAPDHSLTAGRSIITGQLANCLAGAKLPEARSNQVSFVTK
jgi:NADPH:quinone reductase-like Zn-dependent oxidoreductase